MDPNLETLKAAFRMGLSSAVGAAKAYVDDEPLIEELIARLESTRDNELDDFTINSLLKMQEGVRNILLQ